MDNLTAGDHLFIVAVIIAGAGLFGGLAGFLMQEPDESGRRKGLGRWLILGVVASALMPLALSILSSTIVADSAKEPYKFFIFGGLCLIAAIFSNRFIILLGENVLKRLTRTELTTAEMNRRVDVLIDSHVADDEVAPVRKLKKGAAPPDPEQSILGMLADAPGGRWYSAGALSRGVGYPEAQVREELSRLRERGVVESMSRSDGAEYWYLERRKMIAPQGSRKP